MIDSFFLSPLPMKCRKLNAWTTPYGKDRCDDPQVEGCFRFPLAAGMMTYFQVVAGDPVCPFRVALAAVAASLPAWVVISFDEHPPVLSQLLLCIVSSPSLFVRLFARRSFVALCNLLLLISGFISSHFFLSPVNVLHTDISLASRWPLTP